jgi:hypothetical protein
MSNKQTTHGCEYYTIRLKGHLASRWSEWLEGLTVAHTESGETILSGPLADQAALHGVLARIRDLGLPLLAVSRLEPDGADGKSPCPD